MKTLILLVATVLAGCATTYQPQGFSGGFSETRLTKNIFKVSFKGNGMTNPERTADFVLLRSAELALENGFSHFVIIASQDKEELGSFTIPGQSYTTGTATASGNTIYGSAQTTHTGGDTYITRKPTSTNTIVCFETEPKNAGVVYDAQFLRASLKQKYKMQ